MLTKELIIKDNSKNEKNIILLIWEGKEKGMYMTKKKFIIKKVKIILELNLKNFLLIMWYFL